MAERTLARIAAGVAMLIFAGTASAQQCGDRAEIVKFLQTQHGEMQTGAGLLPNGAVLEFYRSKEGTFTFLATLPNGQTCLVAVGEGWMDVPQGRAS